MTFLGSDTACLYDIGLIDTQVTDPVRLVGERLARRLTTPRGALGLIGDDPNAGFDVRQYVNGKLGPSALADAQAQVQAECLKDEQVESCICSMYLSGGALTLNLAITTAQGPFALTLNIGALTTALVFAAAGNR